MLLDSQELNIIYLTAAPATGQDRYYYYYSPRHTNYHNGNGDPASWPELQLPGYYYASKSLGFW